MHSHAGAWERENKYRLNLVPTLLRGNAYHTCYMLLLPPPLLEKLQSMVWFVECLLANGFLELTSHYLDGG